VVVAWFLMHARDKIYLILLLGEMCGRKPIYVLRA
jgi:hypothetical protein